jgi:antirestriction protein
MRIYVANLASYVAGRLHGDWFDLMTYVETSVDVEEALTTLREEIHEHVIAPHGGEEIAIHDYEGFGDLTIGEYSNLETLVKIAWAANDSDYEPVAALLAWISNQGLDYADESIESFRDHYHGEWESGAKYAEDFAYESNGWHDTSDAPDFLSYIDWGRYWHGEFECAGWWISKDGYVFDGN